MLLLGFLLPLVALTAGRHVDNKNWIITIDDDTLKEIRIIGKSPDDLNLSNLNLKSVEKGVFDNFSNLKTLNLANNSLTNLPDGIFLNLTNLEHLNLANNALRKGQYYRGLGSLKTLNISNNPSGVLEPGHFYGLNRFTDILTKNHPIRTVSSSMIENPKSVRRRDWSIELYEGHYDEAMFGQGQPSVRPRIKVCIHDGRLKSLESFEDGQTLDEHCRVLVLDDYKNGLGIRTFESGWYRVQQNASIRYTLNLGNNEIVRITESLLNDLPNGIDRVSLRGNRIQRLERGTMVNDNRIKLLDLRDNRIDVIEKGALERLNIVELLLDGNRLRDTNFLDSLPANIDSVSLSANDIGVISSGNFTKFTSFSRLNLSGNAITEANAQRLNGLSTLRTLDLSHNRLENIEPGFFHDLKNLEIVDLRCNNISKLERGVFDSLGKIIEIDLSINKLTEVTPGVFSSLPKSLETVYLNGNRIGRVTAGTFVKVPWTKLDLSDNEITAIEGGSFVIPKIQRLRLGNNSLRVMDGDSFEGLTEIYELTLASNGITTIEKGAAKNLNKLVDLDLSDNPIKVLKNGALFGLTKIWDTHVRLSNVPVEIIQCGLFEDITDE